VSRRIFLLSSSFVHRASLAALLGAGCLAGTAFATPEDTFPQAPTKADILRWLAGNSDLNPAAVVTMTDELVVAITSRQDGRGVGRSTRLTLREEVINPDAAAAWGGRSIQLDLDLDCARHRAILGARRIYSRPNLQGSARISRSDNAWSEVPPDTVIDDVARSACAPPTQLADNAPVPRPSESATVAAAAAAPPVSTPSAEPPPVASPPPSEAGKAYAAQVPASQVSASQTPAAEPPAAPPVKTAEAPPAPAPAPASVPASAQAPPPAAEPVKLAEAEPVPAPVEAAPPAPPPEPVHVAPPVPVSAPVHLAAAEPAPPSAPPEAAAEARPAKRAKPVKVAVAGPPPAAPVTVVDAPAGAVTVIPTEPVAPPQAQLDPAPQPEVVHNPFVVAQADPPAPEAPAKGAPPAPKPTPRPAAQPTRAPDVAVQIAAVASAELAHDSWQALKARLPSLVAPLTFAVEPVDANGRTLYRALLLGFATQDDAASLCKTLRSQSVDCILRQMK
jgi:hypothetical protein